MKAFNEYKKTTTKDRKCVKVHRQIVENILGISLPSAVEIHHIDYNKANNKKSNLVVCQDRKYHQLLHRRTDTLLAGYNPDTHHKCNDCGDYKENTNFSFNKTRASGLSNICKECQNLRSKERYWRNK